MSVGLVAVAPNREPLTGVVELCPGFPNNESAVGVIIGAAPIVKVVEPELGKEAEAGVIAGFETLLERDGVIPAAGPGNELVVVKGIVLGPCPSTDPSAGVVFDDVGLIVAPPEALLREPPPKADEVVMFPEALPAVPKTLVPAEEAFPNALVPGLAVWHEVSYGETQEDDKNAHAPTAASSGLVFMAGLGLWFGGLAKF